MNTFDDWNVSNADDFALPGEAGFVAKAPEPVEVDDPGEFTSEDAMSLAQMAASGFQIRQESSDLANQVAVAQAVRQFEDGEEEPAVIADNLRNQYGIEVAQEFVRHWKADEVVWEDDEPELPETADEWVQREQSILDLTQAVRQAEHSVQAAKNHEANQAEIDKAFNESVQRMRQRHIGYFQGQYTSIKPDADVIFPLIEQLGATVNPTSPDEARYAGERLYREALEVIRAGGEAKLKSEFDTGRDRALADGYLPSPQEMDSQRHAPTPDQALLANFAKAADASRAKPRPTLEQDVSASFAEYEAKDRMMADGWNV